MDTRTIQVYLLCVFSLLLNCLCDGFKSSGVEETQEYWNNEASDTLRKARNIKPNIAVAKNVILFLGDGMGISTVTAARILKGQNNNRTGEEGLLSFESFPNVALSKTYNMNAQTADSAGTATAFVSGVKTNYGVLGVDGTVFKGNCAQMTEASKLKSILHWSQEAGKSVGLVTTARVTHATPGALYSNSPDRDWESDANMEGVTGGCVDIARQLIDNNININVVLGGGRRSFLRKSDLDPESGDNSVNGRRDNRSLVEDWQRLHAEMNHRYSYVWNQTGFDAVDPQNTDYLLGLFNNNHMNYEVDRAGDQGKEPSLVEMTEKAIQILSKNKNGFFLLVEGGRIDHGHHATMALRALTETVVFADAVSKAATMTTASETLIVTTADHSHVFTIGGYPSRGNPIFGLTDDNGTLDIADDGKPFTTLMYANGPGSFVTANATVRPNLTETLTNDRNYRQQSAVPLSSESHGGEDVAIYAQGPMSHLFHGVHEQHYIAHVMAYASCIGRYSATDSCAAADVAALVTSSGRKICLDYLILLVIVFKLIANFMSN